MPDDGTVSRMQLSGHPSYPQVMAASAHDVAAEIRAALPGVGITAVHKMLYLCQGHHLALFGEPLFTEVIEAWRLGPVVADLWKYEKNDPWEGETYAASPVVRSLDNAQLNTIGYIVSRYGRDSGNELVRRTHREGPWKRVWAHGFGLRHKVISREELRSYFAGRLAAERAAMGVDLDALDSLLVGAKERERQPAQPIDMEALRVKLLGA